MSVAKVADNSKSYAGALPGDIMNDLEECFTYYDKKDEGVISDALFRNIL